MCLHGGISMWVQILLKPRRGWDSLELKIHAVSEPSDVSPLQEQWVVSHPTIFCRLLDNVCSPTKVRHDSITLNRPISSSRTTRIGVQMGSAVDLGIQVRISSTDFNQAENSMQMVFLSPPTGMHRLTWLGTFFLVLVMVPGRDDLFV